MKINVIRQFQMPEIKVKMIAKQNTYISPRTGVTGGIYTRYDRLNRYVAVVAFLTIVWKMVNIFMALLDFFHILMG